MVELDHLRLGAAGEAYALHRLFGEEGGDAAVERLTEVRQPHLVAGDRVQQALGPLDHLREVAELLDLLAGERVDHRQVVGGVGERHRGVGTELGERLVDSLLGLADDADSPADRPGRDIA